MHKRALSKDYDYFIALYARVVKFACHFNNWLPADAGLYRTVDRVRRTGVWTMLFNRRINHRRGRGEIRHPVFISNYIEKLILL